MIRYSYLWRTEAEAGAEEGVKDRPCAVVVSMADAEGHMNVLVLPITRTMPARADDAVELPDTTKRRLGLDAERSWVIVTEANRFKWPGPDLRPIPGRGVNSVALGMLPPRLFAVIRERFLAHARMIRPTIRTE